VLRSFEFSKNAAEVILVTDDLKIKFYSLSKFEGVYLREVATVHRGSINSVDLSLNGGFMLSGGDDNLIKVWDYEAQKTVPYYFQAFIGHTYPITDVMFNPCDNN
jgi:WD40 repeat protein